MPKNLRTSNESLIVGVMSGTSCDGVDVAIRRFSGDKALQEGDLVAFDSFAYPSDLREPLLEASSSTSIAQATAKSDSIASVVDFWIGSVQSVIDRSLIERKTIDLIVSHGQTLFHDPSRAISFQYDRPDSWFKSCGVQTLTDVRQGDLQAGGQGAPLAPLYHKAMAARLGFPIAIVNIGGMANVSICTHPDAIVGFDTGPGNVLLDLWIQEMTSGEESFDSSGELAAHGVADVQLVQQWIEQDPYFEQTGPKSTGRDRYGPGWIEKHRHELRDLGLENGLASLSLFTARTVAMSFAQNPCAVRRLVVVGGGAHNTTLLQDLQTETQMPVEAHEEADSVEASLMCLIGWHWMLQVPSNIPSVTGAREGVVLGKLKS